MASGSASSPRPAPDENEFPFGCPPVACQEPAEPRALRCAACLPENVRSSEDQICPKCQGDDPQSGSPGSPLSQEKDPPEVAEAEVGCPFAGVGCPYKGSPRLMQEHEVASQTTHLNLLLGCVTPWMAPRGPGGAALTLERNLSDLQLQAAVEVAGDLELDCYRAPRSDSQDEHTLQRLTKEKPLAELQEKLRVFENIVAVLNKEVEASHLALAASIHQSQLDREHILSLEQQVSWEPSPARWARGSAARLKALPGGLRGPTVTSRPCPVGSETPQPSSRPCPVGLETPRPRSRPFLVGSETPQPSSRPCPVGLETPRPRSRPFLVGSETPRPRSRPCPVGLETPRPRSRPFLVGSETPRPRSRPCPVGLETPRPRSRPFLVGLETPRPRSRALPGGLRNPAAQVKALPGGLRDPTAQVKALPGGLRDPAAQVKALPGGLRNPRPGQGPSCGSETHGPAQGPAGGLRDSAAQVKALPGGLGDPTAQVKALPGGLRDPAAQVKALPGGFRDPRPRSRALPGGLRDPAARQASWGRTSQAPARWA
ncbi:unnamed protein product [Nyctereutes procyonoides]|uniref:(raccoon dog) hypothetical protein n=1 Tax=Nyctereutes procyonoides TaxID=34880 RepID=A0A811ZF33_NYCPR|nr:unnamed protein product [Nyctereutes procyonoides]